MSTQIPVYEEFSVTFVSSPVTEKIKTILELSFLSTSAVNNTRKTSCFKSLKNICNTNKIFLTEKESYKLK